MTNAFLLATQWIEIDALIRDSGLNPRAFSWVVRDSETTNGVQVTRLQYGAVAAPHFFQFDRYREAHYAVYSWDGVEQCQEHTTRSWPRQVLHVLRWLAHLSEPGRGGLGRSISGLGSSVGATAGSVLTRAAGGRALRR